MKNILCIGLDAAPEAGYAQLLTAAGYHVVTASMSLDRVVSALRSGEMSANLVIVECHGLSRDENDRLWKLRKAAPDVPIIMLADCLSVEFYLRALALGIAEYRCKPILDHEVMRTVEGVLHGGRFQQTPLL